MKLKIGDKILMPESTFDDCWVEGGFKATVTDIMPEMGMCIVIDFYDDSFTIEIERAEAAIIEND